MRVEVLIEHLVHDGRRLAPGAVLDLDEAAAEALVALGAAREAPEAGAETDQTGPVRARPRGRA